MASVPISFEFFPPKTDEQRATLEAALPRLKALAPEYVSCTFGAGGSTLSYTPETIRHLREEHGLDAAPHLSCMGGTRDEIRALLDRYKAMGCKRIVALRGDLPSGMASYGDFRYASDLVEFIRRERDGTFHIEVACYPEVHPQSDDAHADLRHFKAKVDAGANGAITQYFYNPDGYFRFVEAARREGIAVPIVPGIMRPRRATVVAQGAEARARAHRCRAPDPLRLGREYQVVLAREHHQAVIRIGAVHANVVRGGRRGPVGVVREHRAFQRRVYEPVVVDVGVVAAGIVDAETGRVVP